MTKEEAIERWVKPACENTWNEKKCRKIIEALEQEPCDNCISRQAVEKITWEEPSYTDALNVLTEVREKVRALPPANPQTKWIPVSERLPDIDEEVLVDDGIDRFVAWWVIDGFEEGWHSFDGSYNPDKPILAWMPLPEPYKTESEDKK